MLEDLRRLTGRLDQQHHGPARIRQVHWVIGELSAFLTQSPDAERTPAALAEVFSEALLARYLACADAGMLRTRPAPLASSERRRPTPRPSPLGAQRVRRSVLRLLATSAGLPRPLLPPPTQAARPPYVPDLQARKVLSLLFREVTSLPAPRRTAATSIGTRTASNHALLVRTALVAGLVYFHDLRLGEIAALRLDDLVLPDPLDRTTTGDLTYVPNPPGDSGTYAPVTVDLAPPLVEIARTWLFHRERQVAAADNDGRTRALLVSVRWGHGSDGSSRPPGLPITARSLTRAHTATMRRLNELMVGRAGEDPDWEPLDRRLGALRPGAT